MIAVLTDSTGAAQTTGSFLPLLLIAAVFLFIMLRQRARQRARQGMLDALEVGESVRTIGGIIGTLVEVDETEVVLDVDGTRLRMLRRAIQESHTPASTQ